MFTGIVTAVGTVARVRPTKRGLALTVRAPFRGLVAGESIAVDGACLTVVKRGTGTFTVEAIGTTRGRTRIGSYREGSRVNLERALAAGDRLSGHIVSGHVDGVGRVVARRESGDTLLLDIEVPADVYALCVPHGSITVAGVSLTINGLEDGRRGRRGRQGKGKRGAKGREGVVQVALIAHTREATTLGAAAVGHRVHLEADLIGKFVRRLLPSYRAAPRRREP